DLKRTSLAAELEKAGERRDEASTEVIRVRSDSEADASLLGELNAQICERSTELESLRGHASELRTRLDDVHARRDEARHRLKSLEDLDAHHAYYSDAVQHVLSREHAARINALGTLADFVEVEPQYEQLIESLFARELQSVLVPTIDDALAGVEFIKNEGLGRGAFLVVGLHGGEEDGDADRDFDEDRGASEDTGPGSEDSIESWFSESEGERETVRGFELVPQERQLPPADFSVLDAIVIRLDIDSENPLSDFHLETPYQSDERIAARQYDDEA